MTAAVTDKARALLGSGQYRQGLDLLGQAARSGDAGALEMLAAMALSGEIVNRDLKLSRDLYGKAAQAGSIQAAATYRAFVASGTGGPADWAAATMLTFSAASAPD